MTADPRTDGAPQWPAHLRTGAVRFARASSNYESTVAFYRDLVGLPVLGVFVDSFGADGTIFGLPDASVQLEIVRARDDDDGLNGGGSDQLVLYLDSPAALPAAVSSLREAGLLPDPEPHAYWAANGAVTYRDPDGRAVVFAPWVYGRDPEPVDREENRTAPGELRVVITVAEHDTAVAFYSDALGLRELAAFTDDNGGRATLLDAGRATVELGDELHADAIDALEVGRRVAGQIRLAFAVQDAADATERLVTGGGRIVAPPTTTPWGSVNARLESPDQLQFTVFSDEVTGT
jgi:lactoylglutathione lyase